MSFKRKTDSEQAVMNAVPCRDCSAQVGEWCILRRRKVRKQRDFSWLPTWLYDPPTVLGDVTESVPTERAPVYRDRLHPSRVFDAEEHPSRPVGMTHVSYEEED